jgi:hypothetical protein
MPRQLTGLAALVCAVLVVAAEAGHAVGGHVPGVYPADRDLGPEQVVRAYVGAINRRDGVRFCGLVASWISGRFDLAGNDPDAPLLRSIDCPQLVHGFIGYIEDCCPPKFVRAEIVRIGTAQVEGELRRVDVVIRLHVEENGKPRTLPLEDVVWLTRDRGAWRIAQLGAVAAAASLVGATSGGPLARPDVAAERRRFAGELSAFERRQRTREASYRRTVDSLGCRPGMRVRDPAGGVRDWILPAPRSPLPNVPRADLLAVSLARQGNSLCIQFETAGHVRGPSEFHFSMRSRRAKGNFFQSFEVELRSDGRARVTSGVDAERRPLAVPATVGVSGRRLTLLVDRRSFAAGNPGAWSVGTPSLDRFGFGASMYVRLSTRRETADPLGTEPNDTFFTYPSGRPCPSPC